MPVLRVSAAQSQVPIPVRQVSRSQPIYGPAGLLTSIDKALVKNLYDHFLILYEKVLPSYPSLAAQCMASVLA